MHNFWDIRCWLDYLVLGHGFCIGLTFLLLDQFFLKNTKNFSILLFIYNTIFYILLLFLFQFNHRAHIEILPTVIAFHSFRGTASKLCIFLEWLVNSKYDLKCKIWRKKWHLFLMCWHFWINIYIVFFPLILFGWRNVSSFLVCLFHNIHNNGCSWYYIRRNSSQLKTWNPFFSNAHKQINQVKHMQKDNIKTCLALQ